MKFDAWLFLESNKKIISWIISIILIIAFGYQIYNLLILQSIISFVAIVATIIIWFATFSSFGGVRKYVSFFFGSKIELDVHKWYAMEDKDKTYQRGVLTWLTDNKIKYYKNYGSTFYFLKKVDYMAFKLRWSY